MSKHIALDIGAESGRVIVGIVDKGKLELDEVYRFSNGVVQVGDSLHWDVLHIWDEIKKGLRKAAEKYGADLRSIAIDTWGIDYALLNKNGHLINNPHAYRDPRTTGVMEKTLENIPQWQIYLQSGGIQFMSINTIYQLYAEVLADDPSLRFAETFLMMPDLFNYWLTGQKVCEFTNATTTQFYNAGTGQWANSLLEELGIPIGILPAVTMPGSIIGTLLPAVAEETNLGQIPVFAVASHDTASAVIAVPAKEESFAWLSSGTWSLLGGISKAPIVTEQALDFNFSNYGGVGGVCLPWKNIMGLWLVQECRRIWKQRGSELSYTEITQLAEQASPFIAVINPDDPSFLAPDDMPAAILAYCQNSGQKIPQTQGEIIRVVLESLALRYRWTFERLCILQECTYDTLYIVGGGTQNQLLCQFTADAIGHPAVAGPIEGAAMGNILLQAVAIGELASITEARQIIQTSCDVAYYQPNFQRQDEWQVAMNKFNQLVAA